MTKTTSFMIYISLLFLICLFSPPIQAAQPDNIATVMEVEGGATLYRNGRKQISQLITGSSVRLHDTIETGAEGRVAILFIDNTEITLGGNSQLKIDEYVFHTDDDTKNKGTFSALRGTFLFISGLISKRKNPDITIETAYGAIGLRGTTVWGGEIDGSYGILVQEGEVSVTTNRGRMLVRKGQGTHIRSRDALPSRASVWKQDKVTKAEEKIALKRQNAVRERIQRQKQKHLHLQNSKPIHTAPDTHQKIEDRKLYQQKENSKKLRQNNPYKENTEKTYQYKSDARSHEGEERKHLRRKK